MPIQVSNQEIQSKALQLGLIGAGEPLPAHLRSRVVAALVQEQATDRPREQAPVAERIVVQPGTGVTVNGQPFPWMVQADRIEITIQPDGSGLVRLTLPAHNVQIHEPEE